MGSAALATSGTSLVVPVTPEPVCHEGRLKKMLAPPPLRDHAVSTDGKPLESSVRLVPPTLVTLGSLEGLLTCTGPLVSPGPPRPGLSPPSPEEAKIVTPALARFAKYCESADTCAGDEYCSPKPKLSEIW